MKTAEEMRQAAAEEIAQDMVRLLDAVLKDKGFPSSCTTYSWKDSDLKIQDRIDELVRRASAPEKKAHVEKKKQVEEVTVHTCLKPERMSLSMDPETKNRYQTFLKNQQTPYIVNTAALETFMKMYRERKVRVTMEALTWEA